MYKRFMIFILLIFLLLVAFRFMNDVNVFLLLYSFTLISLYHFFFRRDNVALVFSAGLIGLVFLIQLIINFSWIWVVYSFSYMFLFGAGVCFRWIWDKETKLISEKKILSDKDREKLLLSVEKEKERCHDLETQLIDIIGLYELAKDLNLCLSYDEIVTVLRQRIIDALSFRCIRLILKENDQATRSYEIEPKKELNTNILAEGETWEQNVMQKLDTQRLVLRFGESVGSTEVEVEGRKLYAPVWAFPLIVEGKLIAGLVVEGAHIRDYHKFQIVSAQLALQVKKVSLYSTVRKLSIMDGLTQVFVRRHFLERFEEELRRSIRHDFNLVCLMIDIDHFKTYNDDFGHLVGDVTLRAVAEIIHSSVRQVDIVCRYGGEEFAVVLPETKSKQGIEAAERIRSRIAKKYFKVYDEETKVTVSIGVSAFPDSMKYSKDMFDKRIMLELLKRADQALYKAKEEGRNRVVLYE